MSNSYKAHLVFNNIDGLVDLVYCRNKDQIHLCTKAQKENVYVKLKNLLGGYSLNYFLQHQFNLREIVLNLFLNF